MEIIRINGTVIDRKSRRKLFQNYLEEGMTVVHCSYVSKEMYVNGGWVNIYKTTYLIGTDGGELGLVHAENIPLAPGRHMFSKAGELKKFSLYFPLVPKSWDRFDFVERTRSSDGFVVKDIQRNSTGAYQVTLK